MMMLLQSAELMWHIQSVYIVTRTATTTTNEIMMELPDIINSCFYHCPFTLIAFLQFAFLESSAPSAAVMIINLFLLSCNHTPQPSKPPAS